MMLVFLGAVFLGSVVFFGFVLFKAFDPLPNYIATIAVANLLTFLASS
jgi:hypothetical protein